MGIRFNCPNGHKLNVKEFLAGKRGVCPQCGAKFIIPMPAEAAVAELSQPVGIGLSQSVEIAVSPAPSRPAASVPPSPSVIIPVTEIELVPLELVLQPAAPQPEIPLAAGLPESILAGPPPIVAAPAGVASEAVLPFTSGEKPSQSDADQFAIVSARRIVGSRVDLGVEAGS